MENRCELGGPAFIRTELQLIGHCENERNNVLTVQPGIRIVCFDYVTKQEGSTAIGARKFERLVDVRLAVARKMGQEAYQG